MQPISMLARLSTLGVGFSYFLAEQFFENLRCVLCLLGCDRNLKPVRWIPEGCISWAPAKSIMQGRNAGVFLSRTGRIVHAEDGGVLAKAPADLLHLGGRTTHVRKSRLCFTLILGIGVALLAGCGNGNVQRTTLPSVTVSISPQSATVSAGQSVQFTAGVTGSSNTQVNWLVNGASGGSSSAGTITSGGYYSAPATASPQQVTVEAVSQADASVSATASVVINGAGLVTSTSILR